MVDLERSIYDYIHNLLFSKEKIMNTLIEESSYHLPLFWLPLP